MHVSGFDVDAFPTGVVLSVREGVENIQTSDVVGGTCQTTNPLESRTHWNTV